MRIHVVLALAACIVAPAGIAADPFSDFRIPEHVRHSASVDVSASGDWDRQVDAGSAYRNDRWDGAGGVNGLWARDSDRLAFGGGFNIASTVARYRTRSDSPTQHRTSEQNSHSFRVGASSNLRWYPGASRWGFQLVANAAHRQTNQVGNEQFLGDFNSGTREQNYHEITRSVNASGAFGFGRVRDATPVYVAYVLEERMLAAGALSRSLSQAARQRVVDVIALRPQFTVPHERPDRFFWHEIERIAIEDGASDGFDAASAFRANEPIAPYAPYLGTSIALDQRPSGFFIGVAVAFSHEYIHNRSHRTESGPPQDVTITTNSYSIDLPQAGPRIAFHRPIGWAWQAGVESQALVPLHPDEQGLDFTTDARVGWQVADRWRADAVFTHERTVLERRGQDVLVQDFWRVRWGAALAYYVEDRTQVSLAFDSRQDSQYGWSRHSAIRLGANYRFWGWFNGPALFEPQRQMFGS